MDRGKKLACTSFIRLYAVALARVYGTSGGAVDLGVAGQTTSGLLTAIAPGGIEAGGRDRGR